MKPDEGCTHGSTVGFHLQTRDTDGGRVPLLREQEGKRGWADK